jgi:hypothetical protein
MYCHTMNPLSQSDCIAVGHVDLAIVEAQGHGWYRISSDCETMRQQLISAMHIYW